MIHPVQLGKSVRMSYSRIDEVLEMPNLIEVQKNSYRNFLEEGLREVFRDISPITDYTGNLILEFVDYSIDGSPKYSVEECKERDATYAAPLKVKVRLINKETGEVKEQDIFMGDFPLMTENGTFIINGAERVIVSQLVRSPGIYYAVKIDKTGKKLFSSTVIPNRGAWLEYETDSNDVIYVRIDRTRKLPITVLVRALGYGTDFEIIELLGEDERLLATIQKDNAKTKDEGLLEIYKRLRPGEPPTVESATTLLHNLFFDPKRYDLAKVGRFKFNKKLSIAARISGFRAAEDIVDPNTGEIIVAEDERIDKEKARLIQNAGINSVYLNIDGKKIRVLGNNMVDIKSFIDFDISDLGINEYVKYDVLTKILSENKSKADIRRALKENIDELIPKYITPDDIIASI
ncbi:MAG TPA: DNA-directed RNA polymerase subunit beta, partial [Clostridiaceae bacterium]|nr:DNA-directed RNA polymerase subunit beta [Clostridiaceae bacterium]